MAQEHLRQLVKHAIAREFSDEIDVEITDFQDQLLQFLRLYAKRAAKTSVEWLRVGYVQGNMNSDNCLISGRTMDYGPFGFMENYHPLWNPFTSDPERKFGFERQVMAAQVNLGTLADALSVLFTTQEILDGAKKVVGQEYPQILTTYRSEMRKNKLGLNEWNESLDESLWKPIYNVLIGLDYTIFFRQLSNSKINPQEMLNASDDDLLKPVLPAIYDVDQLTNEKKVEITTWMRLWLLELSKQESTHKTTIEQRENAMKKANPKYVPREWMLKEAYDAAEKNGNYEFIYDLQTIFNAPYDEHVEFENRYYKLTPNEMRRKAGVSFYS